MKLNALCVFAWICFVFMLFFGWAGWNYYPDSFGSAMTAFMMFLCWGFAFVFGSEYEIPK